jgi:acetyl esterase/lipase
MNDTTPNRVEAYWRSMTEAAREKPDQAPDEVRARVEAYWPTLTAEPGGTDYLETSVAGLPALWAVPTACVHDRVLLCLHGGGGVSGSIYTHRKLFGQLAKASGTRALLAEYHQAPAPVPAEDAVTAYRWLLEQGIDARNIAVAGDSLGGGLAVSTALRARQEGLPGPAALLLISPWVDMTVSSTTFETNRDREAFFYREVVQALATLYVGSFDPGDPQVSPVHADLRGLPPTYVQVGGNETLLGESLQLAENARLAGVDVRLDVFPDQLHTFQMAAGTMPEADDAIRKLATWVGPRLGPA